MQSNTQPKQATISSGHGHFNREELLRVTQKKVKAGNSAKPQLGIRSDAEFKIGAAKLRSPKMPRLLFCNKT